MELLEAKEELKEVNTQLTLYMKKKKALQDFIEEENKRLNQYTDPKTKAYSLKKDEEYIKLYGDKVIIFDKQAISDDPKYDKFDNNNNKKVIFFESFKTLSSFFLRK